MDEKYVEDLYTVHDMVKDKVSEFAENPKLDHSGLAYLDTLMHTAKNLQKVIKTECEGGEGEYSGDYSHTGRYGAEDGGNSYRSYRSGRYMRGTSGRRDSRGRYASDGRSGHDEDILARIKKMADMTTSHDERQVMLSMIDRLKSAEQNG